MGFATLLVGQLTGMDEPARPLRASVRVRAGLGVFRRPITVIHVSGDHDYRSRAVLLETLAPLEGHTVIDLTDCTFIDPSVIAGIIGKALALGKDGYRLELVVPTYGSLSRVVERLGIHSLIPVVDEPPALRPFMP
jgi:anti-anti-sigma regulatory factor